MSVSLPAAVSFFLTPTAYCVAALKISVCHRSPFSALTPTEPNKHTARRATYKFFYGEEAIYYIFAAHHFIYLSDS